MGKVKVGEFEFDNLKEAQDYAAQLKADPNYVPPVKEEKPEVDPAPLAEGEGETNDGFIPAGEPVVSSELKEAINQVADQFASLDEATQEAAHSVSEASDALDKLTDEDPELAEELDAALDEDQDKVLTDAHDESAEAGA